MSYLTRFLFTSLLFFYSIFAIAQDYTAGVHYRILPDMFARQPAAAALLQQDAGKTEVLEFFNYYCPGCFYAEPAFELWRQKVGNDVAVHRVPVAFHAEWEVAARAYYVANELNMLETIHADLFQAIQKERQAFVTQGELADFFAKHGVDPVKFNTAYEGFNVNRYSEQAKLLKSIYQIRAIPALVVGGRYYTDLGMAKTPDEMMAILDYLIKLNNEAKP